MSSNRRDEESQRLLNGQVHTEENQTFYVRTFTHVTTHRKRYFALWLLAALAAIGTVLGLHYYHHNQNGGQTPPGEFAKLLKKPDTCESDRSYPIAILLSIFFGYVGIDRFYLGYIITGLLKLATAGGFGIWYVVDIVLICVGGLPDHNGCKLVAP
ncbi:hypothetical protein BGX28_002163 [Mortierella sp. GBA30]|nr:hypothetical protein BGX28_002163 [Mortierella sp. GBA30]